MIVYIRVERDRDEKITKIIIINRSSLTLALPNFPFTQLTCYWVLFDLL